MSEAETLTAFYASNAKAKAAEDDLIATGIPREKVFAGEGPDHPVKVITPKTSQPEIMEILNRHQPKRIEQHELSV